MVSTIHTSSGIINSYNVLEIETTDTEGHAKTQNILRKSGLTSNDVIRSECMSVFTLMSYGLGASSCQSVRARTCVVFVSMADAPASVSTGPSTVEEPEETPSRLRGRKRARHVSEWKRSKQKRLRNSGQEYTTLKNKRVSSWGQKSCKIHHLYSEKLQLVFQASLCIVCSSAQPPPLPPHPYTCAQTFSLSSLGWSFC